MHVSAAESEASDWAGSGRRSRLNRPTSSSAKWFASTELPPFPNVKTRPPAASAATTASPIASARGSSSSAAAARERCSARASALGSAMRAQLARGESVDGDRRRTHDAYPLAERRLHDPYLGGRGRHRVGEDARAHRPEQLLPGAADHT